MATVLLSLAVLILAGAAIAYPLFFHKLEPFLAPHLPDTPFSERDSLLEAMSELELEYHGGKVSEEDYAREKNRLQRSYIEAVRDEPDA